MKDWKIKFLFLGVGQAVSILTSSVLQIVIIWYLTQATQSAIVITMATLAGYLPRGVIGLFTGVFIDRFDRKKILIISDMIIAFAALLLAFAAIGNKIPVGLIFLILCIRSVGAAFHAPALNAVVPTIVPKEQLARCAGITQGFETVSLIISPALAAILYNVWSMSAIILLDVLGAAVAILIICLISIPSNVKQKSKIHLLEDTKEGFSIIRSKGMFTLLVVSALYAFIYFPIGSMYPFITMNYFGGSVADSSFVEIIFSAGTLMGAFLLGIVGKKVQKIEFIAMSIGIYGLGTMLTGMLLPRHINIFIILSGIMGITIPFFHGLRTAIFQTVIPNEYLGRVLSLVSSVSLFAAPLGLLIGGGISEKAGIQNCFLFCGILAILLAVVTLIKAKAAKKEELIKTSLD